MKLVLGLAFLALAGCATLSGGLNSPLDAALLQAGVDVGVGVAVKQGITPAQLTTLGTALQADSTAVATVASIEGVINVEGAKLKLNPADAAALQILSSTLAAALVQAIQASPSATQASSQATVALQTLGKDLVLAAALYH